MAGKQTGMRRVLLGGMVGNGLEWYDYAIYGHMAVLIGQLFFPEGNAAMKTLQSFGVFAVGFVARPFGGILFGWLADRFGRRFSLSLSVLLMAGSTGAIGCMPTYAQIGWAAPVLLVVLRIVQGLSVGGEFSGAITYMVEHARPRRRGLIGSMAMASLVMGFVAGSLVASAVSHSMSAEAFQQWGWRIPFLLGVLIGLVGFFIRRACEESPLFEAAREEGALSHKPVREVLSEHWLPVLRGVGVYFLVTMPFYMASIWFIAYNKQTLGLPMSKALAYNTVTMIAMLAMVPLTGWLSDKYGRKPTLDFIALLFLVCSWPIFGQFDPRFIAATTGAQIGFALLVGAMLGPVPALLTELFPTRVRTTGLGISYNIAAALFGGTAPLVCTWLLATFKSPQILGGYVILSAVCGFLALWRYRDGSIPPPKRKVVKKT